MNPSDLKAMLEQSQNSLNKSNDNINFTKDEADKFKKAFQDPEFRKLFSEYLDEMQDPSYRKETEEYIQQLENEQKVPEGKELIRPSPLFVAKSKKVSNEKEEKIFINIVTSNKINEPSKTTSNKGEHWSVPYSLGPPHMEKDKNGDNTVVFDCCFNTIVSNYTNDKRYENLLVNTACDGIEEYYKRMNTITKIKRDYHIVKGIKYKEGQVLSMLISSESKNNWNINSNNAVSKENSNGNIEKTKTSEVIQKETIKKNTVESNEKDSKSIQSSAPIKKGFLLNTKSNKEEKKIIEEIVEKAPAIKTSKINKDKPDQTTIDNTISSTIQVPKYTVIERGNQSTSNLGDFEAMNRVTVMSNRPNELVYRIELPLAIKPSLIILDIYERSFKLKYQDVYELSVSLSYPVFDKKGSAKYDKNSKTLTVTLPVQPHKPTVLSTNDNIKSIETSVDDDKEESNQTAKLESNTKSKNEVVKHDRWVDKSNYKANEELTKTIKEESEKVLNSYLSTKSSIEEVNQTNGTISKESVNIDNIVIEKKEFYPSSIFTGSKSGYYYSVGDLGLGYYIDKRIEINKISNKSLVEDSIESIDGVITDIPFEYAQTTCNVSVLLNIPSIIPTSVKVSYSLNGFDIIFKAITNNVTIVYAKGFDINYGCIDAKECQYDVASKNMAILLMKSTENQSIWKEINNISIVSPRAYKGIDIAIYKESLDDISISDKRKSLDIIDNVINDKKENNINPTLIQKTLNEMKIQSNILFELD